jgi:hypothetical protein
LGGAATENLRITIERRVDSGRRRRQLKKSK